MKKTRLFVLILLAIMLSSLLPATAAATESAQPTAAITDVTTVAITDVSTAAITGVSATKFGTDEASCQMYLTFVLRSLDYSDAGGTDFTWDKPEALALSVSIMPKGIQAANFLRADAVMISEAALSAKLKNSRDTLLDKLKTQENGEAEKEEPESTITV